MKTIEKIVVALLIMIICFQAIFPSVIYGYTEDEALDLYKNEINTKIIEEITRWLTDGDSKREVSSLSAEEKTVLATWIQDFIDNLPATLEEFDCYNEIENDLNDGQKQNLENNMNEYIENLNSWDFINAKQVQEGQIEEEVPQSITKSQATQYVRNKLATIRNELEADLVRYR